MPFYVSFIGDIEARDKGSLVAHENGVATPFGITGAQSRGVMMIAPKDEIYRDMIIGLHQRPGDLRLNVCKVSNGREVEQFLILKTHRLLICCPWTRRRNYSYVER